MAIITISHAAFTGGTSIAEKVAAQLQSRCVNREVLIEASERYGIPEAKFAEILETEGHWWERWLESVRLYRITLQAAMCEVAQGGNIVYHGRAGQELFPGITHVLKVLTVAAMDFRIEQVKARRGMDVERARQFLKELDRVRGRRLRFTDAERALLARKAKAVGRKALLELDTIVSPDTLLRWHRRLVAQKWHFAERRSAAARASCVTFQS